MSLPPPHDLTDNMIARAFRANQSAHQQRQDAPPPYSEMEAAVDQEGNSSGDDSTRANRGSCGPDNNRRLSGRCYLGDDRGVCGSPNSVPDHLAIFINTLQEALDPTHPPLPPRTQGRLTSVSSSSDPFRLLSFGSGSGTREAERDPKDGAEEHHEHHKDEHGGKYHAENNQGRGKATGNSRDKKSNNDSGDTSSESSEPSESFTAIPSSRYNSSNASSEDFGAPLRRFKSPIQYRSLDTMVPIKPPPPGRTQGNPGPSGAPGLSIASRARWEASRRGGTTPTDPTDVPTPLAGINRPWSDGIWIPTAEDRRQWGMSDHTTCPICYWCCWAPLCWLVRKMMTTDSEETENAGHQEPPPTDQSDSFWPCCFCEAEESDDEREPLLWAHFY